jgi:myo-inositol-1(or 4)-monophosphatase
MNIAEQKKALALAVDAAKDAGALMRRNLKATKKVNFACQGDIKLDLDVRCQSLIARKLLKGMPGTGVLGEEGVSGSQSAEFRWVVDPIDGTVNYACGIPHACVSIALQQIGAGAPVTRVGVVYDPFLDELWTAIRGGPARLDGARIQVNAHSRFRECIIAAGYAKEGVHMKANMAMVNGLFPKIRKIRMMGSAALALTYVACGRFDGYVETGIRLWDIAAGSLIVECAGGCVWQEETGPEHRHRIIASSSAIASKLQRFAR